MDSLLANYASSDEEEEQQQQQQQQQQQPQKPIPSNKTTSSSSSLFSALPQPQSSSSLFQSLPPPKQPSSHTLTDSALSNLPETSSSLPKPKSQIQEQPKRVVQFKPPIIPLPKPSKHEDSEDEDDEEEERNRRRKLESSVQAPSVKSFLSSIPAPRNSATLGVQASSGSGRRSIIETDSPAPPPPVASSSASESNVSVVQNGVDYENYQYPIDQNYQYPIDQNDSYGNYNWGANAVAEAGADVGTGTATYSYGNSDDGYANYGAYGNYGQYANNWEEGSVATVQEAPVSSSESIMKFHGKRGRKDVPVEVIEVKQDELIKNRPREDQVKLTGLAFGPTYQVLSRFVLFCLDFDNLMYICPTRK